MRLLIFLAIMASAALAVVPASAYQDEFDGSYLESVIHQTHTYWHNGQMFTYVIFHGYRVLEPEITMTFWDVPAVKAAGNGKYYVALPLDIRAPASTDSLGGSAKWANIKVHKTGVHFGSDLSRCSICKHLSASIRNSAETPELVFTCNSKSVCGKVGRYFYDSTPESMMIFNYLRFDLDGSVKGKPIKIAKGPKPRKPSIKPTPTSKPKVSEPGVYNFEPGKMLLYTTKANVGRKATYTFLHRQHYKAGAPGEPLPAIYRSDLLDQLAATVKKYNKRKMVAEMRKNGKVVAQVVFDVERNSKSLNLRNWFNRNRVLSSYPYYIGKKNFNFFSVMGDNFHRRSFFINTRYVSCEDDVGFWAIINKDGACKWEKDGWRGSAPTLAYNPVKGSKYQSGSVRYADRFLIYLTNRAGKVGGSA